MEAFEIMSKAAMIIKKEPLKLNAFHYEWFRDEATKSLQPVTLS